MRISTIPRCPDGTPYPHQRHPGVMAKPCCAWTAGTTPAQTVIPPKGGIHASFNDLWQF